MPSKLEAIFAAVLSAAAMLAAGASVEACPFCTAVEPSWSERRDAAAVVVLTEPVAEHADLFLALQVLKGSCVAVGDELRIAAAGAPRRGLILWTGAPREDGNDEVPSSTSSAPDQLAWEATAVDEVSYAYFARLPPAASTAVERLRHCAKYLEHANADVARDAYLEFGRAPFDIVELAADAVSGQSLRSWIDDPRVPQERQGLYGLMLGLARGEDQRRENAAFLRERIERPAIDFRAGFDGLIGGYLLLAGNQALDLLERRFFANPSAATGDVRHAMTALRFYVEFGRHVDHERLFQAARRLVERHEFASAAIVDLARWQDWQAVDRVAAAFDSSEIDQRARDRAVVGYLMACPTDAASRALDRLRSQWPKRVEDAEAFPASFGGRQ